MDRPFPAYKGDDPYVFVSYAHEDSDVVFPEIQWLKDQGFNLWYDEGISPGSEWRDELAERIEGSSLFLYFITPRSIASEHCKREVNYAIDQSKQLLSVHLAETELSSGLGMSLSSIQAIMRYELSDLDYRIKLLKGTSDHLQRGIGVASALSTTITGVSPKMTAVVGLIALLVGGMIVGSLTWDSVEPEDQPDKGSTRVDTATGLGKPVHYRMELPAGSHLAVETEYPTLSLSPDGTKLVFVASKDGTRRLYLRLLSETQASPIAGTEGAVAPVFSPDGQWIGFVTDNSFEKVPSNGGVPVALGLGLVADVMRGVTWTANDTLIFVGSANSGLAQFSIRNGVEETLTSQKMPSAWPEALPSGRDVLFADNTAGLLRDAVVTVLSLETGNIKTLVNGSTNPKYSKTGHLLYARAGSLFATPFDAATTELTGPEFKLVDGVVTGANGAAQFSVAADGTLAYVAGGPSLSEHELVWVDRDGNFETLLDNGRQFLHPRLSPDGSHLALMSPTGPNLDVWVLNIERGSLTRWTTHPGEDFAPVWSPDGRLAFASEIGEDFGEMGPGLAWMTGPSQQPERLLQSPGEGNWDFPTSWSPDGRWLLFSATRDRTAKDIYLFDTESRQPQVYLGTQFTETSARFSPDGRWVAYVSDQSGRPEVYVRSFPGEGDSQQMSNNGGEEPLWSPDGTELFYREGTKLIAVTLVTDPVFSAGPPRLLFDGRFEKSKFGGQNSNYDVTPDGRRFIMVRRKNPVTPTVIHVVLNWPKVLGVAPE